MGDKINEIKEHTQTMSDQLNKLEAVETDEDYLKELAIYDQMLNEADFSLKSHAVPTKKKLKWYDKAAPLVNKVTKQVNKVNKKLEVRNQTRGNK